MRRKLVTVVLCFATSASLAIYARADQSPADNSAPMPGSAVADLERLVSALDREERDLRTEDAQIAPELTLVRQRMHARARAYYKEIRAGFLPAGSGFDALVDHAARVERIRRAIERDVGREAQLLKRGGEIATRLTRLHAERAPLEVQREAMSRARAALQEAEERRAAFTRAFETSIRPSSSIAIYGADTGTTGDAEARSFKAQKGRLLFPVAGRAEIHKVRRTSDRGPAIELVASAGAVVRNVAAGRVAFADEYDDYGLTAIVDHGDHYYTVYAHLGSLDVKPGDVVAHGGRLGTASGGKNLHFEIRHHSEAVEPGPWLGL